MVRKRLFGNVFKNDGNVIISRDIDSGEDVCSHDWVLIRTVEDYEVFRCGLNDCIKVHSPYRSSIAKFIKFLRALPKIDKLPEHSLLDITELASRAGLGQRQAKKYYRVLQGLDIDGRPVHTMADSRPLFYLDDNTSDEGTLKKMKRELNERYERLLLEETKRELRKRFEQLKKHECHYTSDYEEQKEESVTLEEMKAELHRRYEALMCKQAF